MSYLNYDAMSEQQKVDIRQKANKALWKCNYSTAAMYDVIRYAQAGLYEVKSENTNLSGLCGKAKSTV